MEGGAFGTLLRRYRRAAGLSQEELAARAQVSERTIRDLERGVARVPRRDTVALLTAALGLPSPQHTVLRAAQADRNAPVPVMATPAQPPFVGRTRELTLLERHLAGEGPPLLVLAGEPGIGKTRLLHAALPRAMAQGLRTLHGGCQRRGGQEPYAPLLGALRHYFRSRWPDHLRTELHGCAWLVRLLPELAEAPIPPLPSGSLTPEQERRLMGEAVGRFLSNVAGPAGTLLMLDDLQWASPDALDLLATLVHAAAEVPLRVIGAYRDTEAPPHAPLITTLTDLAHAGLAARRRLGPLAAEDAAYLLEVLLAADPQTDLYDVALRERIVRRTGGVPFFLVSWAEDARLNAGLAGAEDAMPWDITQSIGQRVAALPEAARELIGVAAVLGRVVEPALLTVATTHPERDVLAALDLATQVGLLQEETQTYRFAHDVIREVVEADLGLARRLVLHRRVAAALEGCPGEPPLERLAYHYARGDLLDKAALYLERAGDQARAQYANAAAEGSYREAVGALDRLGRCADAARVREKLGTVLRVAGQYEAALEVVDQAVAAYYAAGDLESVARTLAGTWVAHAERGTVEEGIARFQSVLHLVEGHGPSYGLAALSSAHAMLLYYSGRYDAYLTAVGRTAELARAVGDTALVTEATFKRGHALLSMVGGRAEALCVLQEATQLDDAAADRMAKLFGLAGWFNVTADAYLEVGDFGLSQSYYARGVAIAERHGEILWMMRLALTHGKIAFYTGNWGQAAADFQWAEGMSRQLEASRVYWRALLELGTLYLCQGERDLAARYLEEGRACAERVNQLEGQRHATWLLAECDVLEGHPDQAHARVVPLLDRPGLEEAEVDRLLVCLAWATLELGDGAGAEHVARQALRRIRSDNRQLTLVEALRVQAMVVMRQEHWAEATTALQEGLELARSMPYPYAEARLLHVYGQLHLRKGELEPAQERLEAALTIFQRLGACQDAERVTQAMADLAPHA